MDDVIYDIIIIGSGPAGLTAAIYARRAGKRVLILEKSTFGGQVNQSPKIENYPAYAEISGPDLAEKMLDHAMDLGAELELDDVIQVIDDGTWKCIITEKGQYTALSVIIAVGAKHRTLGLPREDELTGNGISYCVLCDGAFFKDKDVAVVGGGNTALQDAVLLAETCRKVTIVQNLSFLTGEEKLIQILKSRENVDFIFDTVVAGLQGETDLTGLQLRNTKLDKTTDFPVNGVFVAIGMVPENGPFAEVCEIDENGYIVSDERCRTKTPGIFVAGDCRTKTVRQITTATADGAIAALAACKYLGK